jgi:very-short-patch-repair endonuclease
LKLVIEIDGAYHFEPEQRVKDMKRRQLLEQMGLRFLRFTEQEVRKDMDMVLKMISGFIDEIVQRFESAAPKDNVS